MKVIVFGAENCSGCVNVKRVLEQDGIKYEYYDVNDPADMNLAMEYRVRSIPTVVVKGEATASYVGEKNCMLAIKTGGIQ